jgi:hypothetical protein
MSQENVDRFVKGIEAFNRGDVPGLLRFMDPEIHFEQRLAALQGDFVGLDGEGLVRGSRGVLRERAGPMPGRS